MLTPKRYWRVAKTSAELQQAPSTSLPLPSVVADQKSPPVSGDGVLLADYDSADQQGVIRFLGIVRETHGRSVTVDWRPTLTQIWVDTPPGRAFWSSKEGFCFAASKVAGYGLHALFAEHFEGLEPRETLPQEMREARPRSKLPKERTEPMQVVGDANRSPRGGYVYVLKSAYGYKVGRARSMPDRMKTFAVKLPFVYTIPLCAWFDDHIDAESRYHRLFVSRHLVGEWFMLDDADLEMIRQRRFEA